MAISVLNLRGAHVGLLLLIMIGMLAACGRGVNSHLGNDAPNLTIWVEEMKRRPALPLDPLPAIQQFETFEYDAQDLRGPFSNLFAEKETGRGKRPDPNRRKQPTENFPLDSFSMVGSIGVKNALVALVLLPSNVIYRVHPGVYMGQNDGRVIAVSKDHIDLVELIPDGSGGWLERSASIVLQN